MKHIKLYESFLGFGRIYEAESSKTEDQSEEGRNRRVIVLIVNGLKKKLLPLINKKISEGIPKPLVFELGMGLTISGNLNLTATDYKINEIRKIADENPEFSTFSVKGYANMEFKYTLEGLENDPIKISFTAYFNQKLELDFVEVVKIYPPALSISTDPKDGHIEEAGHIYLDNSKLMYCSRLDGNQKPQNPKTVATLKFQDKVEFAFDSSKKGAPFVHKMSEEEKNSLNI
jgi:hypothetical protein